MLYDSSNVNYYLKIQSVETTLTLKNSYKGPCITPSSSSIFQAMVCVCVCVCVFFIHSFCCLFFVVHVLWISI